MAACSARMPSCMLACRWRRQRARLRGAATLSARRRWPRERRRPRARRRQLMPPGKDWGTRGIGIRFDAGAAGPQASARPALFGESRARPPAVADAKIWVVHIDRAARQTGARAPECSAPSARQARHRAPTRAAPERSEAAGLVEWELGPQKENRSGITGVSYRGLPSERTSEDFSGLANVIRPASSEMEIAITGPRGSCRF